MKFGCTRELSLGGRKVLQQWLQMLRQLFLCLLLDESSKLSIDFFEFALDTLLVNWLASQ